jgi:hypothetical protein
MRPRSSKRLQPSLRACAHAQASAFNHRCAHAPTFQLEHVLLIVDICNFSVKTIEK